MKLNRIPELDGLRAFAVLFVVIYHMTENAGAIPVTNHWAGSIISCLGISGVHIFFVISGFIITSLLMRETQSDKGISLPAFYIRRFFRIVPPFAAYLLTLFLLNQGGYLRVDSVNFLWSSLFLTNLDVLGNPVSASAWFFYHSWSLSVEEQYYLFLPPIMVSVLHFRLRPLNWLLVSLFCLSLASIKFAKELSVYVHPALHKLIALFEFRYIIVGVLMAIHKDTMQRLLQNTSVLLPVLFVGVTFLSAFAHLPSILAVTLVGIEAITSGLLVMWFVENPAKCSLLRWNWIQWVGTCSYSIYLWQQLFTGKASFYSGWTVAQSPLSIVAILVFAALSQYLIERPGIWLGRLLSQRWQR